MSDRMATRHTICALSDAGRSNKKIVRIHKTIDLSAFTKIRTKTKKKKTKKTKPETGTVTAAANIRPELRPQQCFLELWPQLEKHPLQFGSLRGLDWGPNLVP